MNGINKKDLTELKNTISNIKKLSEKVTNFFGIDSAYFGYSTTEYGLRVTWLSDKVLEEITKNEGK